jgi:hypothetical protein
MKRLFLGCIAALAMLLPKITLAQMPDTNKIEGYLQYVMQPLNKSQIPTGYLEEFGFPAVPMATYNGTLGESNYLEPNLWRLLYFQLYTGYFPIGWCPHQPKYFSQCYMSPPA